MINFPVVFKIIGILLLIGGMMMLTAVPFSLVYESGDAPAFLKSAGLTLFLGFILLGLYRKADSQVGKREGYLIVALGWLSLSLFGALPYLFSQAIPDMAGAFFETVSGFTTTGSSVLKDIESIPAGILYWRSLTQWLGGMGIVLLTVAILPLLGIGGVELFVAEVPGPTKDKIHPRIRETAKRLWLLYIGLTFILAMILFFSGSMNGFDSINHAMTTLSTGGFSTKNASIAHFSSPFTQYTLIFFMFLAGTNFTIIYFGLKGQLRKVWSSDEFKAYSVITLMVVLIVFSNLTLLKDLPTERAFRDAAFQVVSVITTTGYISADYTSWSSGLTFLFFVLLFVGASAGSTSGGIKVVRHLVFIKNTFLEFKRLLHPQAIIRVKIDKKIVTGTIITHILVFLLLYLILFVAGSMAMSVILRDSDQSFLTAIGSVATALGNVGPGIGNVGPVDNFASIPASGKLLLSFLMLCGRLELFTILILFVPYFWRSN